MFLCIKGADSWVWTGFILKLGCS